MPSTAIRSFSPRDESPLHARALRDLAAALPALYAETELARLPAVFAKALAPLVPADAHGVLVRNFASGYRTWCVLSVAPEFAAPAPGFFAGFREFAPDNCPPLEDSGDALALVNLVTRASLHQLSFYRDVHHPLGAGKDFDVALRRGEVVICATAMRRGRGFGRQELALLQALRPHLQQAWCNAEALADLKAAAGASPSSNLDWDPAPLEIRFGLTPRESEVLIWVAQGKTNGDVATILGITAHTVRTHLERVFEKLGVETRLAASFCALEVLGLHPPLKGR